MLLRNCAQVFSGGLDNEIKIWDLRKEEIIQKVGGGVWIVGLPGRVALERRV